MDPSQTRMYLFVWDISNKSRTSQAHRGQEAECWSQEAETLFPASKLVNSERLHLLSCKMGRRKAAPCWSPGSIAGRRVVCNQKSFGFLVAGSLSVSLP